MMESWKKWRSEDALFTRHLGGGRYKTIRVFEDEASVEDIFAIGIREFTLEQIPIKDIGAVVFANGLELLNDTLVQNGQEVYSKEETPEVIVSFLADEPSEIEITSDLTIKEVNELCKENGLDFATWCPEYMS